MSTRHLQCNPDIISAFRKLCRPFLNWRGNFVPQKYYRFISRASERRVTIFYKEAQQFIVNLVNHIYSVEKGVNQWSRYFIDLTILLASGIDTSLRAHSIDNARATVDINSLNLEEVLNEIPCMAKKPQEANSRLRFVVAPADFTLLYNVGDFFVVGLDLGNRKLIRPQIIELKTRKTNPAKYNFLRYKKQIHREGRQAERILKTHILHEIDLENKEVRQLNTFPTYLATNQKVIWKLIKSQSELVIDDVFSVVVSASPQLRSTDTHFIVGVFEEIMCGHIIPSIFKGVNIRLFETLMAKRLFLYIKTDKNKLYEHLKTVPTIKKIDRGSSSYNAFIYLPWGRISLANIIHMKYPIQQLETLLSRKLTITIPAEKKYYVFGPV